METGRGGVETGKGRGGGGGDGSKKSKLISAPSYGARLKSCPILAPPPLRGGENLRGAKRGESG